jgi:hypothetical protein
MVGFVVASGRKGTVNLVVDPSARETFTPRELTDACKHFEERGPQYVDAEAGLRAAAYRFGTHMLLVYVESEAGVVTLIHPTPRRRCVPRSSGVTVGSGSREPARGVVIGNYKY